MTAQILHGNNLDILPTLADCSVDSIVTDPPYELGFMGKQWDATGIAYNVQLWRECLRVLKPGGHLLAFGGTRTYHRMAVAIEDAGFEIRDSIHWIYGSGFPKSLDVSKAIDKAAGVERPVLGPTKRGAQQETTGRYGAWGEGITPTAPATDAARQWDGWGTALKPAHEPIVLARKPLIGTVTNNVLTHGTGALNIDRCRIAYNGDYRSPGPADGSVNSAGSFGTGITETFNDLAREQAGRWPANVIFDENAAEELGEPARYFYCPKAGRKERNAGLEGLPEKHSDFGGRGKPGAGVNEIAHGKAPEPTANFHPTVKPLALMRYLIRLVTPPGGTVLEPFAGSGTTLAAATLENFNSIGIELTADYLPIIEARIAWAEQQTENEAPTLFSI